MTSESERYENGDRVRLAARPEWGIGTIVKTEPIPGTLNGHGTQRLAVRFPNAGLKTIVTGHAELTRVNENDRAASGESPLVQYWENMNENDSDWLASAARKKVEEAMISLPPDVRDPFNTLEKRLTLMVGLYRFDRSGRGLMDWAVAQTGLDDPLSRFTRQELEQKFDRWVYERDQYLAKLVQEARAPGTDPAMLRTVVKNAPPAAAPFIRKMFGGIGAR